MSFFKSLNPIKETFVFNDNYANFLFQFHLNNFVLGYFLVFEYIKKEKMKENYSHFDLILECISEAAPLGVLENINIFILSIYLEQQFI